MRVKEFAQLANVTERTIRWYTEKGLLKPTFTGKSNKIANYSEDDFGILFMIQILSSAGKTIEEIKEVIDQDRLYQKDLFDETIDSIRKKQEELEGMIQYLEFIKLFSFDDFIVPFFTGLTLEDFNVLTYDESVKQFTAKKETAVENSVDTHELLEHKFELLFGFALHLIALHHKVDKPESTTIQNLISHLYQYIKAKPDESKRVFGAPIDSENQFTELLQYVLEDPDIIKAFDEQSLSFLKKAIAIYGIRTS